MSRSVLCIHPIFYTPDSTLASNDSFIHQGSRPSSPFKDSAEPPYTVLSQHDRTADIYEA